MPAYRAPARPYDRNRAAHLCRGFMRAGVLLSIVVGLTLLSTAPVPAQSNWWESITGTPLSALGEHRRLADGSKGPHDAWGRVR
jgi:hypothetical protein